MAHIIILGPEGRTEAELAAHNTLGRHPNNTIQILDRIVSKEHCHIDWDGDRYVLRDLGSLNGTYVNGERVSQRPLSHGDELSMGSTRVLFQDAVAEAPGLDRASEGSIPPPHRVSSPGHTAGMGPTVGVGANVRAPQVTNVTIAPGVVESHIRTKLAPLFDQSFLPERMVPENEHLRRDYEKLRASYEISRAIGVELDADKILAKVLDAALSLLPADRGVVLLFDENRQLRPQCVRTKRPGQEEVHLSTTILNEVIRDKAAVLSSDATVDSRFQGAHSIIMQGIRSTMAVPLLHSGELFGVMILDSQVATNAFTEKDLQLFQNISNQAAISIQNSLYARKLEQEAVTRERFGRLLSPAIAEQVLSGRFEIKKGGELRSTTVLFTDIRGFTSMSEARSAQEIVDMLNEYFELMVEIIFKYEGTLDKFVGDEIMALFGAPVSHADDPVRAVRTALEMLEVLGEFNSARIRAGHDPLYIGIGINTGDMVAGYLGSSKALEYTVIGDAVNTGARLCSVAKAGEIIISEHTHKAVAHLFDAIELPPQQVKGKANALKIFRVVGEKGVSKGT